MSCRGGARHRTRNLELPRCAIAHLRSGPSDHPGMMVNDLRPGLQRLVDLGLEHIVEILRRQRADHLVENGAVAPDNEGFGHPIDAPFDRGAAVAVDADYAERVAVTAEKAPGVVGRVLVVD